MVYYIILFVYTVLVQYAFRNVKGKEKTYMFLTLLPLFLYGALRVSCGDYEIYEQYNGWVRSSGSQIFDVIERMEPGYAYLNKLFSYRWVIVICSLFSCYAYGYLIVKLVPQQYRWFYFFLFFIVGDKTFYFMFSSIRNSISISIFLIYLAYRINNQNRKQSIIKDLVSLVLITVFAGSFHASAYMFFPIAYLATVDRKISSIEIYIWLVVLGLLWIIPIDQLVNENWLVQTDYFSRYDEYVEDNRNAGVLAKVGATIFALLCLACIRFNAKEILNGPIARLALLFVYSYMLGSLNMRVSYYFIPFAIVHFTFVYANRKKNAWMIALLLFSLAFLFYSSFVAGNFAGGLSSPFVAYKISIFL